MKALYEIEKKCYITKVVENSIPSEDILSSNSNSWSICTVAISEGSKAVEKSHHLENGREM